MKKIKTQKELQKKHVLSANFKKHNIRSAYSDMPRKSIKCEDGLTEQHHAETCDVNNILATYMKTGVLPPPDPNAQYGDLSDFDYQSLQNQIANAHSLFEQLPDNVKFRFGNEPYRFLNFVQDERNYDELIEMGLANAPEKKERLAPALQSGDAVPLEEETASDKPKGASGTVDT